MIGTALDIAVIVCGLYCLGLLVWWWIKVGKATEVYVYITMLYFAVCANAVEHVATHCLSFKHISMVHNCSGWLVEVLLVGAMLPLAVRMTRRYWIFTHSTPEEMEEMLHVVMCPLVNKYCGFLATKQKGEVEK